MGEFRIGRRTAQHSYPEPRRTGGAATAYARNYATGPKIGTSIIDATPIPWNSIDVGGSGTNVPITPITTGTILIRGVVSFSNGSGSAIPEMLITATLDTVPISVPAFQGIGPFANGAEVSIPFQFEVTTTVGVQHHIQIVVFGDGATLTFEGSSISVEEVQAATG